MIAGRIGRWVAVRTAGERPEWVAAARWRRLDPYARLACTAVAALGVPSWPEHSALALGTAFGAVASTREFLDSLAAHGDAAGGPTPFINSVHNAAAGAIGELLGLHGPVTTATLGGCSGGAALRWALLQLAAGTAPRALVLIGDGLDAWAAQVVQQLTGRAPIGQGLAALELLPATAAGRLLRPATASDVGIVLDDGGGSPAEARRLGRCGERLRADVLLGAWWPTAVWCMPEHLPAAPLLIREREGRQEFTWWLGSSDPAAAGVAGSGG